MAYAQRDSLDSASSARHMLSGHVYAMDTLSPRPSEPFQRAASPLRHPLTPDISLTAHYLPTKFSSALLSPNAHAGGTGTGPRKRKTKHLEPKFPKRGGGVDAFKHGAPRIPGRDDELDFGEPEPWESSKPGDGPPDRYKKKLLWNRFKWTLLIANTVLMSYSITALIFCLLTWFNTFTHADILRIGNRPELIISTVASSLSLLTSLIGYSGILLNNRRFLALYNLLLWLSFILIVIPGYITCRKREYNLEGKMNLQWSRSIDARGRGKIQNGLKCCGYFNPFIEATATAACYSRSILPGCKLRYLDFQRRVLKRWYGVVFFVVVPPHLVVMVVGVLCSNHITYRFGKGMMPKRYRLSVGSMAVIMDRYASQLAEGYALDVGVDGKSKSVSTLDLPNPTTAGPGGSRNRTPSPYPQTASAGYSPSRLRHETSPN